MNTDVLNELMNVVERKHRIDQHSSWSNGSSTYFVEIVKEIEEAREAMASTTKVFLEDELGDVLWDYLSILRCLVDEKGISLSAVFERSLAKYEERISGIENGVAWSEIKEIQRERLRLEAHGQEDGRA
jgi:NTP pyrophosphatase (non-canonical NTP hydrolase)